MAARRKTAGAPQPAATPGATTPADTEGTQEAKGVFVAKGTDANGRVGVVLQLFGVEPTEIQTLLEMGVAQFRRDNGLPPLA